MTIFSRTPASLEPQPRSFWAVSLQVYCRRNCRRAYRRQPDYAYAVPSEYGLPHPHWPEVTMQLDSMNEKGVDWSCKDWKCALRLVRGHRIETTRSAHPVRELAELTRTVAHH